MGAGKLSLIKVCNEGHFGRLDAASRTGCQMAASSHTAVTVNTKKNWPSSSLARNKA